MTTRVPMFPLIYVTVAEDGSAHLNVSGRHVDFPAGPIAATRAAIVEYAASLATQLDRPVRMNTTDPSGTWLVAVHHDSTVSDLATAAAPTRHFQPLRPRARSSATSPTQVLDRAEFVPASSSAVTAPSPAAPTPASPAPSAPRPEPAEVPDVSELLDEVEQTRLVAIAPVQAAVLTFSTGETAIVRNRALIGRRPILSTGEPHAQAITLTDPTATVSKSHCLVFWQDDELWVADRQSGNGTIIVDARGGRTELVAGVPAPLVAESTVEIGQQSFTVAFPASR